MDVRRKLLDEFAHGGTKPIKTLEDKSGFGINCAVDPTTGNLAVTNSYDLGSHFGGVLIYTHAEGKAKQFIDHSIFFYGFLGYDPAGNLFVDGDDFFDSPRFAEMPHGSRRFFNLTLSHSFYWPGAVQWHGDELTVGAVTLRVAQLGQPPVSRPGPGPDSKPKAADTAVLDAIVVADDEQEEFEMEFDDGDPEPVVEGIPLADADDAKPATSSPKVATASRTPAPAADKPADKPAPSKATKEGVKEDDAIAQFLLDLKLDDEE